MKRDRFINNEVSYDIYWDPSISTDTIGMYMYGFPGSIGENKITQLMLKNGMNVIQPHYPGTFDSGGVFSPESSYKFLEHLDSVLTVGKVYSTKKDRDIDFGNSIKFAVGHSYGCFSLLRSAKYFPELETIILFGPAITYTPDCNVQSYTGLVEDGDKHYKYVKRSRPFTYRMSEKKYFDKLYSGKYDTLDLTSSTNIKNVIGIVGSSDPYFDNSILDKEFYNFLKKSLPTKTNIELITIDGANHGIKSLLTDDVNNKLIKYIRDACKK